MKCGDDMKIIKHKVPYRENFSISLPSNAEFICICEDHGDTYMYFTVHSNPNKIATRYFITVFSDNVFTDGASKYIGSHKLGTRNRHIFEII